MEKEIIEMYLNGYSTVQIGKTFGVHYSSIRNILIRNNIKLRSNKSNSRKYYLNEKYFDIIDTEEKAYWLGFIYADGYITSNKFGISLKSSDYHHLEKLNICLNSTYPINLYKNNCEWSKNEYCRLLITSEYIVDSLVNNGVFRNKTKILKPPKTVPYHLIRHFIRGYFDGDGGIIKNGESFYGTFVGLESFINWIDFIIYDNISVRYKKLEKRHDDDFVVSSKYFGKDCYKLI